MKRHNRYHTNYIIRYKLGLLPPDESGSIPRSTRTYWKNKDYNTIIGASEYPGEYEQFSFQACAKAARCLWIAFYCFSKIMTACKQKQKLFREHRNSLTVTIEKLAQEISITNACRMMLVSVKQFYVWKNEIKCSDSFSGLCLKTFPQQLTAREIRTVKTYLCDAATAHWSLISVYYKMLRDNAAYMSKQTFYHCARTLGFTRKRRRKPRYSIGIRASKPFELLHVDVTLLRLPDNTRVYIQIITDNFSRAILSCKAALTWNALHTATHLREVCEHWKLYRKSCTLMCDNGSENQGALHLFLEEPHVQIQKLTAQLDTHFSNSMAEATNKRAKYYYLLRQPFRVFEDVERYLPRMMEEENNRFHYALLGFTPNEVLAGALPDKKFFASKIKQAAEHRRLVNRAKKCKKC